MNKRIILAILLLSFSACSVEPVYYADYDIKYLDCSNVVLNLEGEWIGENYDAINCTYHSDTIALSFTIFNEELFINSTLASELDFIDDGDCHISWRPDYLTNIYAFYSNDTLYVESVKNIPIVNGILFENCDYALVKI